MNVQRLLRMVPSMPLVASQLAIWCAFLFVASPSYGQTSIKSVDSQDIKTLERRLENFFVTLANPAASAGPQQAFQDLLTGGPLLENEQKIKDAIEQAKKLPDLYGKYNGFEKVKQGSVGEDVCVMTYLYKGKLFPVAWHFTFYRAQTDTQWVCIGVRFDSKVEDLAK